MNTKTASISIIISLILSALLINAGSQNSIMVNGLPLFAICAPIGFLLHWTFFIPSFALKTDHYFDLIGSTSYVLTILTVLMLNPSLDTRDIIIGSMIIIWAVRLGSFLFTRIKQDGKDVRLDEIKTKFIRFLNLWTLGGLWVLVTVGAGLAAIASNISLELGFLGYIGIGLWVFGFIVEVMADAQKRQFKKDPSNKNGFITTGVWSWSQHPNYFGEITLWTGIALIAFPVLSGWQLATLVSPLFVYLLLTKVSGINLLDAIAEERWGADKSYKEYTERTSKLFMLPPKKS